MKTEPHSPINPIPNSYHGHGLTKREHFAALAMQGYLSNSELQIPFELLGMASIKIADALIAALNEVQP